MSLCSKLVKNNSQLLNKTDQTTFIWIESAKKDISNF